MGLRATGALTEKQALIRDVGTAFDSLFTWDYEKGRREQLNKLYEKAKTSQWNAETDIDWSVGGQIDRARDPQNPLNSMGATDEGPFAALTDEARANLGHASIAWTLSQFMHGEQGALLCPRSSVRPRSSMPCRGWTPGTTPPPRSWTRHAMSRCTPSTCARSSSGSSR